MKQLTVSIHHKLHGCVVIVMEQDLVQRLLQLGSGNNATFEIGIVIVLLGTLSSPT